LSKPAVSVLATIPAVLMAGNALSVRHPWRMTFKVGGTPPGALASAFTQIFVIAGMAILMPVGARLFGFPGAVLGLSASGLVRYATALRADNEFDLARLRGLLKVATS